jgi:membrane-bound serine protease (ClpP class)
MNRGWLVRILTRVLALWALGAATTAPAREALVVELEGVIGPAASAYVAAAIANAESRQAHLLVLRIDTPGGLDTSMRAIVKAINASTVPVVGYVAPSGARAASAGAYILYACHVAAMAPGTNVGAATPVQLIGFGDDAKRDKPTDSPGEARPAASGDAKTDKLVNDAVAYLRSLAQLRGRNAEWAEAAVRQAASLPAEEALRLGVVELVARDVADLLRQLDGRTVRMAAGELTLDTDGLSQVAVEPDWHSRLLAVIGNPNVAYILLLVGIYGLVYEFSNPGVVLPGVVGAVSLLLALYAFQLLPINYAGMALVLLGLALMVAEAFVPSFGALGIGGIASFVIGSLVLVDSDLPGFAISLPLIVTFAVISTVLLVFVVGLAVKSQRRPVVSGAEELLGAVGHAEADFVGEGSVRVHGEVWTARSEVPLRARQDIEVIGRDGLTLLVAPKHTQRRT